MVVAPTYSPLRHRSVLQEPLVVFDGGLEWITHTSVGETCEVYSWKIQCAVLGETALMCIHLTVANAEEKSSAFIET